MLNGVDATWLDGVDKAALRDAFEAEIAALDEALSRAWPGRSDPACGAASVSP